MADAQATAPKPSPRRKSGKHPERALSAAFVRTVMKPGRYCDGHGLYLNVIPSGARSWVQRIVIQGRRRELGLGGYPLVSLSEAREVAFANRKLARAGGDPLTDKRRAEGMPTFAQAAAKVYEMHRPGWRNAKYAAQWKTELRTYAYGRIGEMPVSEVTTAEVLEVLGPIWHDKAETARRVRARIGAVMKWAVAQGYRGDNPAGEAITQALPRHRKRRRVPLSGRAMEILRQARGLGDGEGLVFPGARAGRPLADATLSRVLRQLGIEAVPHGFRSSFRDWAAECTNAPRAVMEAALAHAVRDPTEAAYARSDLLERRRKLMEDWAAYLSAEGGKVVPMLRPV